MSSRISDFALAILGSVLSLFLSWPYWRDFEFWAEGPTAWLLYFVVGFILAVYVFLVFIRALRQLFIHESPHHQHHEDFHSEGGDR